MKTSLIKTVIVKHITQNFFLKNVEMIEKNEDEKSERKNVTQ